MNKSRTLNNSVIFKIAQFTMWPLKEKKGS